MDSKIQNVVSQLVKSYERHGTITRVDSMTQPNRELIVGILSDLQKLVFPGFFEVKRLRSETIHYYVGELLENIDYHLQKQIVKAYRCTDADRECGRHDLQERAARISGEFLGRLERVREYLEEDVQAAYDGDPAAYSRDEIIYSYPGLYAIMVYRIAHELFLLDVPMIPRIMTEHAHGVTGIDIHPGASIGRYFFIDHGTGIVIGETTTIGEHVKIYQGVTLGGLSTNGGQQLKGVKRHPDIEDDVTIYSGASILGGNTVIGKGAVIGGNAFVTESVAPGTTVIARVPEQTYVSREEADENP